MLGLFFVLLFYVSWHVRMPKTRGSMLSVGLKFNANSFIEWQYNADGDAVAVK
jgi:hypothetical protein